MDEYLSTEISVISISLLEEGADIGLWTSKQARTPIWNGGLTKPLRLSVKLLILPSFSHMLSATVPWSLVLSPVLSQLYYFS